MPRSHWIIAATFGFISLPLIGQTQETPDPALEGGPIPQIGEQESRAQSDDPPSNQLSIAAELAPFLQGIETAIRDSIASEDQAERQRQKENEERDLNAQEEMAFWAKGMFWATVAAVLLTFAALLAIIRTLHHTKIAANQSIIMADQARLATSAAQAAVAETRRIGEAQVRAYISWSEAGVVVGFSDDERPVSIIFEPRIKNWGQSPAILTTYRSYIFAIDPKEQPNFSIDLSNACHPYEVGAGGAFTLEEKTLDIDAADLVFSGDKICYLVGVVYFRDVFLKDSVPDRLYTFCLRVSFRYPPSSIRHEKRDHSTLVRFSPQVWNPASEKNQG